ncbi:MAG: DUF1295 domain-containing protein [Pseudomonadota bacterium]
MIGRTLALIYGVVCYALGVAALGYLGLWLVDLVPGALDAPRTAPLGEATLINAGLLLLFALQHSGMARPAFKRVWTRIVPAAIERSTYVLASAIAVAILCWYWEPLGITFWRVDSGPLHALLLGGYACGWAVLLFATFCIDHFELFGLQQVWQNARRRPQQPRGFMIRGLYHFVRHPIYLGWFLVIWITPVMTLSHLLFALGMTGYTLRAIRWEERDLLAALPEYAAYRERVPMVLPGSAAAEPALQH